MTFTATPLASGILPATQLAIYTVPAGRAAYIKSISLFNRGVDVGYPATEGIILFLNVSGTPRKYRGLTLEFEESADILTDGDTLELAEGDSIEAQATDGDAVHYTITGVIETP